MLIGLGGRGGRALRVRMEREEKRWLYVLVAVFVVTNVVTLSPIIPWQEWLFWAPAEPEKEIYVEMVNYEFKVYVVVDGEREPAAFPIKIKVGEAVRFVAVSRDVTYGLGVFRASDGRMLFQMQVLPKWVNEITWVFDEPGVYHLRSTEYSGPLHPEMVIEDAIEVVP